MNTSILAILSLVITLLIAIVVQKIFKGVKKPDRSRYGLIDLHTVLAFAVVTVVALILEDHYYLIVGLIGILVYLMVRTRYGNGNYYLYQLLFSAVLGIAGVWSVFTLAERRSNYYEEDEPVRDFPETPPTTAIDDRDLADTQAPELKLETPQESQANELTDDEKAFLEEMRN